MSGRHHNNTTVASIGFSILLFVSFASNVFAQTYGAGTYGSGDYGTGEVSGTSTPAPSSSSSGETTSQETSLDFTVGISLNQSIFNDTLDTNTISAIDKKPLTVSVKPPDADQLQRIYIRVLGQEYDLTDPDKDLTYTYTLNIFGKPGSYNYALTADYGTTTLTEYGIIIVKGDTSTLSKINSLFRTVFGRNPTPQEWQYWAERTADKPELPQLLGAMQFHQLQERTTGAKVFFPGEKVKIEEINSLFRSVYERDPSVSEWEYWVERLKDKAQRLPFYGALQWHFEFNTSLR